MTQPKNVVLKLNRQGDVPPGQTALIYVFADEIKSIIPLVDELDGVTPAGCRLYVGAEIYIVDEDAHAIMTQLGEWGVQMIGA